MKGVLEFLSILINEPSFLGALAGAAISGGLALYINSLERKRLREKEKEESKKILLIFQYLAKDLDAQITKITTNIEEYNKFYNPYSNIETYEDDEGYEHLQYYPSEEEIDVFKTRVTPYLNKARVASAEVLETYGKVEQVGINGLNLKELNSFLKFKSDFKKTIEPILLRIMKIDYPVINSQELEVIKLVSDYFLVTTKNI